MEYDLNNAKTPEGQSEADRIEANRIVNRWASLDTDATNWKTHWQECYENIVPRKEDVISSRMPGDQRNDDLYDTTAILANEMLASALHGMLTNPETKFFDIVFNDQRIMEMQEVIDWCQDVSDKMYRALNNTNFQTEIYEIYIDLGSIGTSCLYMGEHEENLVHFSARAMKEVRIDENNLGIIDTVYRNFKWSATQIISEFGEKACPVDVLRAANNNSMDKFEVIHAVEPTNSEAQKQVKKQKFKSTYVLGDKKFILSKGGFREFPYAVPRWSKTTGEKYGRGPGMSMLPDILMINAMALTVIQGAQKTVDPPLMVQDDGVIGNVRLTPGGLTIVRPGSDQIKPLITNANVEFGEQMLESVRNRIRAGFYVDQLQLQQGPQMTAEEVKQRTEEKLRLMGPVLGRQHFELLSPMITRLYDIMTRKKLLPPPPNAVKGAKFDVRYSSLIARAQRMAEGQNMMRALQLLEPLAKVKPQILDLLDEEKMAREVWSIYGNKHSLLLSKRELQKKRDAQQKQQQDMQQKMNEMHQAEVANKAAPMMSAVQQGMNKNAP